ncbi:MAG: MFS transporter, partial [Firmicutes bacterium]|nr:MFS transporter [Bacillota bacterium]
TATGMSKSALSPVLIAGFVSYGAGQIISGVCGDKVSPKKLLLCGLVTTALMNILIPLCQNNGQMMIVWLVNGFAQAFMWPPMARILTELFDSETYNKACVRISWGSSVGTILVYLVSPVIITLASWKGVFAFSAFCAAIMAVLWKIYCPEVKVRSVKQEKAQKGFFSPVIILIMLAIVLQGMLRDGVTTWTPSYIAENFNLSNAAAILSGVVLPVFSIFSFFAASKLYSKKIRNPLTCSGTFFAVAALAACGLSLFTKTTSVSVFLLALLTGCMHGVNFILVSMIPLFFKECGNVSTVSGLLNSCTYVGSAASIYGIAVITENSGWDFAVTTWVLTALLGAVICFAAVNAWNRFVKN